MKLKPSTLFFLLTALVLGGVGLIVQQSPPPVPEAQQAEAQPLVTFQEKQVKSLTLQTQLRSLKFERDQAGQWQMLQPTKQKASDASIAFLLNQIATGQSQRSFTAKAGDRETYGFHQPLATIEVTLDNQEKHKLVLGSYDFNRSNIYALLDPPADEKADLKVLLVSANFENAVSRPMSEWQEAASTSPNASPGASPDASPSPSTSPNVSPNASPSASPNASPSPSPSAGPGSPAATPSPSVSPSVAPQGQASPSPAATQP